jgi:hypothetical protein
MFLFVCTKMFVGKTDEKGMHGNEAGCESWVSKVIRLKPVGTTP